MATCVGAVPPRPAYDFDKLPASATNGEIILALALDWSRGREYEGELAAAIAGCIQPQAKTVLPVTALAATGSHHLFDSRATINLTFS